VVQWQITKLKASCWASAEAFCTGDEASWTDVLWTLPLSILSFAKVLFDTIVMQRQVVLLETVSSSMFEESGDRLPSLSTQLEPSITQLEQLERSFKVFKPLGLLYSFASRVWDSARAPFEHGRYYASVDAANLLWGVTFLQLVCLANAILLGNGLAASISVGETSGATLRERLKSGLARGLYSGIELMLVEGSQAMIVRAVISIFTADWAEPWVARFARDEQEKNVLGQLAFLRAILAMAVVVMAVVIASGRFLERRGTSFDCTISYKAMLCTFVGVWNPGLNEQAYRIEQIAVECASRRTPEPRPSGGSVEEPSQEASQEPLAAEVAQGLRCAAARSARLNLTAIPGIGYLCKLVEPFGAASALWWGSAAEGNIHPSTHWDISSCRRCRRRRCVPNVKGKKVKEEATCEFRPLNDPKGQWAFLLTDPDAGPCLLEGVDSMHAFRRLPDDADVTLVEAPCLTINPQQGLFLMTDALILALEQYVVFDWLTLSSVIWPLVVLCVARGILGAARRRRSKRLRTLPRIARLAPDETSAFGLRNHGFSIPHEETLSDFITRALRTAMETEPEADAPLREFEWSPPAGPDQPRLPDLQRIHQSAGEQESEQTPRGHPQKRGHPQRPAQVRQTGLLPSCRPGRYYSARTTLSAPCNASNAVPSNTKFDLLRIRQNCPCPNAMMIGDSTERVQC